MDVRKLLLMLPLFLLLFPVIGCGERGPNIWNVETWIIQSEVWNNRDAALEGQPEDMKAGWQNGFRSGYNEGCTDFLQGEGRGPSVKTVKGQTAGYRSGFEKGYASGYDEGFDYARKEYFKPDSPLARWEESEGAVDYHAGFAAGMEAGRAQEEEDRLLGKTFSPDSIRIPEDLMPKGNEDFKRGWREGYETGYREAMKTDAVSEETAPGSQDETSTYTDYETGFRHGRDKGRVNGELDKKAGYGYNDIPGPYDYAGNEEYQRGFKDGYRQGYSEGYKAKS